MEMCIGDQLYVTLLFYLDDICIFTENADNMLDWVELVFQRLKSLSLKVKPNKSFYFQDEVNFLGHILSAKGVSPNLEKVEKVKNWPIPTNPKEIHSFVGLASYYRDYRVIAYASQSLRPAEKSWKDYSSAKIELLTMKWAICEKFKDYLLGSKFTFYTDNNPLVYIKSSKLGAAQIRWLSQLALYTFNIIYRTGKSNLVANALSRRPEVESELACEQPSAEELEEEEWDAVCYSTVSQVFSDVIGGQGFDFIYRRTSSITSLSCLRNSKVRSWKPFTITWGIRP